MNKERMQTLEMLSSGKITVEEAERLLNAIGENNNNTVSTLVPPKPSDLKYLCIMIKDKTQDDGEQPKVNIRIPIQLIRCGMQFAKVIPVEVQAKIEEALEKKGVKFELPKINAENIDELINAMQDFDIDVTGSNGEKIRIFFE